MHRNTTPKLNWYFEGRCGEMGRPTQNTARGRTARSCVSAAQTWPVSYNIACSDTAHSGKSSESVSFTALTASRPSSRHTRCWTNTSHECVSIVNDGGPTEHTEYSCNLLKRDASTCAQLSSECDHTVCAQGANRELDHRWASSTQKSREITNSYGHQQRTTT